jgi:hypothetical protein
VAIVCREYAGETRATRAALPTNQKILRRIGIASAVVNWDICAGQPMWVTLRVCRGHESLRVKRFNPVLNDSIID